MAGTQPYPSERSGTRKGRRSSASAAATPAQRERPEEAGSRAREAPWSLLDSVEIPEIRDAWRLDEDGFNLAREHEVESLLAISNGHIGIRASLAEVSELSEPGVFIAGIFAVPDQGGAVPEMLMLDPGWLHLRTAVNGYTLDFHTGKTRVHRRVLDLRRGILWREWLHEDPDGRVTRLRFLRMASLADRCLIAQSIILVPENYSGRVKLMTSASGPSPSSTLADAPPPRPVDIADLPPIAGADGEPWHETVLSLDAPGTDDTVVIASASRMRLADEVVEPHVDDGRRGRTERWEIDVDVGAVCRLDRLISIQSDRTAERPRHAAADHLRRVVRRPLEDIVGDHAAEWERHWHAADVEIVGDDDAQRAMRFACFHLIAAANPEDERSSIGARALTGQAYKGHVFWDTEIYMLPFYVFTQPRAARALLMYRYHTLPAARRKAAEYGYEGALYAWESTQTGSEATPPFVLAPDGEVVVIRNAEQENHISADIAFAVWQYWRATGDDDFLREAGAEILLETARFWASRGRTGEDGRFHIEGVIGPDEYHEDVDDNAYTNGLARWNLERGAEVAELLSERWPETWARLSRSLSLEPDEAAGWREIAGRTCSGFDPETRLFEQFRGYFELEQIDLEAFEPRTVPMDVLLGRERTLRSQVIKQPDVLMLLYLLWDAYPRDVHEANFEYYEPRCGHGSSLSPSIHALLAARLGKMDLALDYFRQAAEIDLANNMGNAAGGVHAAALGGLWQAVVFGFLGMRVHDRGLEFDPRLPDAWVAIRLPIEWRGCRLRIELDREASTLSVRHEAGDASPTLSLAGAPAVEIGPGDHYTARIDGEERSEWRRAGA